MESEITKVTSHISHNEPLIFERSQTGRIGYRLPPLDVEETPIDSITQTTGLPSGTVSSTLLRLEMRKLVRQLPGKVFVRTS